MRQLSLVIEGPLGSPLESVAEALHLAFFLDHAPRGEPFVRTYRERPPFVRTYRERPPDLFALAETLIDLRALTLEEALAAIDHPAGGG